MEIINERYSEDAPQSAEESTDSEGKKTGALKESVKGGGSNMRWMLLLLLLAVLFIVVIWPRLKSGNETDPSSSTAGGVPPESVVSEQDLALLFLAPGSADRSAQVFWDGVQQGTLTELELGLLVEPGDHLLQVVTANGDTLLSRAISVAPNDTLDLEVR